MRNEGEFALQKLDWDFRPINKTHSPTLNLNPKFLKLNFTKNSL